MKKLVLLLLVFVGISVSGQEYNSTLWKISGNGLEQPSYLFGTMHIMPKKLFHISEKVVEIIENSDVVTFEVNMFDLSFKEQFNLASKMYLKNGMTLEQKLKADEFAALIGFARDSLGIREKKFRKKYNRLTPFAVNSLFTAKYIGKYKMYEKEFYKLARKHDKTISELETIDFQFGLVENLPFETQVDYFLDVREMSELHDLIRLYQAQDLNALYELSEDEAGEDEELMAFMKTFLDDRNMDWIPKIVYQISQHRSFIAVGAAHLPGETGVIQLLRNQGYTVEPVIL
ncbi:TraB/GumN family protein [Saccharicrinis sp. FJH54]|uniref:TraB/GumN family protein n=1 Tax=Saccharicrinis sp. FJH54 TaxID=3344665 RepID=UPI0035D4C794